VRAGADHVLKLADLKGEHAGGEIDAGVRQAASEAVKKLTAER
jgi:hypothetical protein